MTVKQASVCILSLYIHSNNPTFYGEFNNSTRFVARKSGASFVLTIEDARPSDMGMYYCATRDYDAMIFGKGADSRNQHLTQQPVSESVQTGDSVTLNCTIHTETCVGEHSVYWFRHGSGESHPESFTPMKIGVINMSTTSPRSTSASLCWDLPLCCGLVGRYWERDQAGR
ncbi:unnamed protein product [Coregonus sp. 'balchen']|nr:unnamed protein product [Coregonus sp. 'balchen']